MPPRLVSRKAYNSVSGSKANFKSKTYWIVAQFIAHKPVSCASLTDSFKIIETLMLSANTAYKRDHKTVQVRAQKLPAGLSRNRPWFWS